MLLMAKKELNLSCTCIVIMCDIRSGPTYPIVATPPPASIHAFLYKK